MSAVYKNQRIVRSNNNYHPLFLGLIFLHRDATFEAYHTFFSTVKASLCKKSDVKNIEISTNKERAWCTKHLKVLAYMQKARQRITEKIFGDRCKV